MDSYQILKTIHKVGHPITGTVIGYECPAGENPIVYKANVLLQTHSEYRVVLPFYNVFNFGEEFDETYFPKIGQQIETVVKNHVEDTLYVSTLPIDLKKESIQLYKGFYAFIEKTKEGEIVEGIVKVVQPFGLFIDIGSPFLGFIDIGHSGFNGGKRLPVDNSKWPKEGDVIRCLVGYYRFLEAKLGLVWSPAE